MTIRRRIIRLAHFSGSLAEPESTRCSDLGWRRQRHPRLLRENPTLWIGRPVFLGLRDHRPDKLLRSRLPQKHLVVFWLKHGAIEIRVVEIETPSEIGKGGGVGR